VDSLVNGLYEYRCECTNDQFNQLILKVELSQNPVLATYKKIDSFSDLIGINVFDMDSYAAGCDSRISKSDTITADGIKYWLNIQNGQVVQRQLDLAGSASIGTYSIDFTGGNVISGSVPVNGSIRDNILYRKNISGSAFDYSLTNCTIEGWVVDYMNNGKTDISDDYTVITGAGQVEKSYDDDFSSYASYTGNADKVLCELSFSPRTISEFNVYLNTDLSASSGNIYVYIQLKINDVWTAIKTYNTGTNGTKFEYLTSGWDNVTGIRFYLDEQGTGWINSFLVYDMTVY